MIRVGVSSTGYLKSTTVGVIAINRYIRLHLTLLGIRSGHTSSPWILMKTGSFGEIITWDRETSGQELLRGDPLAMDKK